MRPAEIPERLYVRGEPWRVVWRSRADRTWRDEHAWGITYHDEREIHLADELRHCPSKLQETWLHELLHACFPPSGRARRGVSHRHEEALIDEVSPYLALALNQTGWSKP